VTAPRDDLGKAQGREKTGVAGGNAGWRPSLGFALRRMLDHAFSLAQPVARRVLPRSVRARLAGVASLIEQATATSRMEAFRRRARPLASISPLLPADRFTGAPLLVNDALAWGGVERQIVYTLQGLAARLPEPAGLLCLRLGQDENYDFYRPSLQDFGGLLRNVVPASEASAILAETMTAERRRDIEQNIGWLPRDVQEDIWRFVADFVRLKPRVVHAWQDSLSISAGYAARLAGVPKVIVAGRNIAPIHFAYHRPHMRLAYEELAGCDDVTMLNNSVAGARSYAAWLAVPEARFVILRNGIDPNALVAASQGDVARLRAELAIPEQSPVIGSIFRFYAEKQPLLWIEAAGIVASRLKHAHFVVFGTGPQREDMLRRARELGFADRVHLPGTIAAPTLGLGLFDVFLLCSGMEGTPNVVLEASLMGVPVVATDAGGTAETIAEGESGFVVRSANPQEIAGKVLDVLEDAGFKARAGHHGPKFILDTFGLERMIDETIALYADVGARHAAPGNAP